MTRTVKPLIKGKFVAEQPHRSAYANPEYKPGEFEQYYRQKQEPKKFVSLTRAKLDRVERMMIEAQQRQQSQILQVLENTKLTFATGHLARKWAAPPTESKTKRDKTGKESLSRVVDEKLYAKQPVKTKKEKPRDKSVQSTKKDKRDQGSHKHRDAACKLTSSKKSNSKPVLVGNSREAASATLMLANQTFSVWGDKKGPEALKCQLANPYLQDFKLEKMCLSGLFNCNHKTPR